MIIAKVLGSGRVQFWFKWQPHTKVGQNQLEPILLRKSIFSHKALRSADVELGHVSELVLEGVAAVAQPIPSLSAIQATVGVLQKEKIPKNYLLRWTAQTFLQNLVCLCTSLSRRPTIHTRFSTESMPENNEMCWSSPTSSFNRMEKARERNNKGIL